MGTRRSLFWTCEPARAWVAGTGLRLATPDFWLCGRTLLCPNDQQASGPEDNSLATAHSLLASYSPWFHIQPQHQLSRPLTSSRMSTSSAPPPALPFDVRPKPAQSVAAPSRNTPSPDSPASTTSDSTLVNDSSAAAPKAELSGGHRRISYPLTSFESTPHNVSAFGFALGIVFAIGLVLASGGLKQKTFLWGNQAMESLEPHGLWAAMTNPVVGIYLTFWATFHMLEFQVTSIWNPGKLSVDCKHGSVVGRLKRQPQANSSLATRSVPDQQRRCLSDRPRGRTARAHFREYISARQVPLV